MRLNILLFYGWIMRINSRCVPVSYQSPVFHSAGGKVWKRHHVHLWQGELDLEIVLEVFQDLWADLQAVLGLIDSLATCPDAEVWLSGIGLLRVEIRDDKGH